MQRRFPQEAPLQLFSFYRSKQTCVQEAKGKIFTLTFDQDF